MKKFLPQDQVYWYLKYPTAPALKSELKVDVVVVGGGMAGVTAAQNFRSKGLSVALVEQYYCGAGASGKTSGFITPDSEYSLSNLANIYGDKSAKELWELVLSGVDIIRNNIKQFSINCDYQEQDTLVVATSNQDFKNIIKPENKTRQKLSYKSILYSKSELNSIIGSDKYFGGIRYNNTFGIKAYDYCQQMKKVLQDLGVQVYEETPVIKVHNKGVDTIYSTIFADNIILCVDKSVTSLGKLKYEIYHAQTFLTISTKLTDSQVKAIFPKENLMVWDTDLIYQYYRLTGDNRLMVGGSSVWATYASQEEHHKYSMFRKLNNYFKEKFDQADINFEYFWPGLIGITKDIMPIAGPDKKLNNIYYVVGCAGLPWASALGNYSAEHIVNKRTDLDHYFSPERKFPIGPFLQTIIGTKASFAISNFLKVNTF